MSGTLYFGDNLDVLRENIRDEVADLIYLDPPFNSAASYNVLFKAPDGKSSQSQIMAFGDTWHWCEASEVAFDEVIKSGRSEVANVLRAMRQFLGENDMMAYIAMMSVRLIELHRVLRPTGSLYLHCDPSASHYLRMVLDRIFGADRFQAEIIWQRTATHNDAKRWPWLSDTILFYTKSDKFTWMPAYRPQSDEDIATRYRHAEVDGRRFRLGPMDAPAGGGMSAINKKTGKPNGWYEWKGYQPPAQGWRYSPSTMQELHEKGLIYYPEDKNKRLARKLYLDESKGALIGNVWTDIAPLQASSAERLGYPTQKPVSLLERIINSSSTAGQTVLDPFCGCGTSVHAAQKLRRRWMGIDITPLAVNLISRRLKEAFKGIEFSVRGIPRDMDGARELALRDKFLFQLWACDLVDAQPYQDGKKGADGGVDGFIYFKPDGKNTKAAIVSVKGGANVGVAQVRDLRGTIERLGEPMGIFVTLTAPTGPMIKEAASAGLFDTGFQKVPKIQILTIEQLLEGEKPRIPFGQAVSYKKASREKGEGKQMGLGL